jgi:hypothetical protein
MSNWTPERRARQAQAIQRWKPWTKATGPKTAAGKARVARNGYKGGPRPKLRALAKLLRDDRRGLIDLDPDVMMDLVDRLS